MLTIIGSIFLVLAFVAFVVLAVAVVAQKHLNNANGKVYKSVTKLQNDNQINWRVKK